MKFTWVRTNLMANGEVPAYALRIRAEDGYDTASPYMGRFRPTGEEALFETLEDGARNNL
jgi:hypothetical protein